MARKIGVAIIGSGIFVIDEHLPAVQACDDLDLKAIYSRSLKSAQEASKDISGVDLYSEDSEQSYQELLAREDVEAVIIALAIPVAPKYIKQALAAGKHVLAEKPLAKDLATALELLDWYKQNVDTSKVTFSIAENFRFTGVFAKAAEQVKALGKVQLLNAKIHFLIADGWKYTNTAWRQKPEYQGGYLLDSGVHMMAVIRRLVGQEARVKRVSAFTSSIAPHLPPVDTMTAILQLENGSIGSVSVSWGSAFVDCDFSVACDGGTVNANPFTSNVSVKPAGGEESIINAPDTTSNVQQEVVAWVNGLLKGSPEKSLSPEEALADLEMVEAMLTSEGAPVDLKYQL